MKQHKRIEGIANQTNEAPQLFAPLPDLVHCLVRFQVGVVDLGYSLIDLAHCNFAQVRLNRSGPMLEAICHVGICTTRIHKQFPAT